MRRRTGWWIAANIAIAIGLPIVVAAMINHDVEHEYAMGWRVTTDGDSISLPILSFTFALWTVLALLNAVIIVIMRVRRSRRLTRA